MPQISKWRLFLTVVALGAGIYTVLQTPIQLGLDLRGGTQIVLEAQDTPEVQVDAEVTGRALEVLRRRVDQFGVAEPTLQVSGERRIIVELPGVTDPDEALEVIGRTAQLTFHPVLASYPPGEGPDDVDGRVLPDESGAELVLGPAAVSGDQVTGAGGIFDGLRWVVSIEFNREGEREWAQLTSDAACEPAGSPTRRIAIVLDDQVISSPEVAADVPCGVGITGGNTVITGGFTEEEAEDLALLIRAGALPVPVEVVEQGTVGPSLGEAAVNASIEAAIIGATLTILYMIFFYRVMGLVAAISLVVYGLLSYAALATLGATLTLPGIAGFVLAIGMAVDANVLVYERAKEEHAAGSDVGNALVAGFKRAWSAIADANITTLLAAILLIFYASGAVRGFGVTVSIGVVVSMFSALVVTRVILELLTRWSALGENPRVMGMTVGRRFLTWLEERNPDLLGGWKKWLVVSAVAVVVAVAGIVVRGTRFGLEFEGGRLIEFSVGQEIDLDELRGELAQSGIDRPLIQETGEGNIVVRTEQLTEAEETAMAEAVAALGGGAEIVRDQFVGPTLGAELRNRALIALGLALVVQLAYLAIRFRWTIGLASVASLFHDVVILIGLFAWMGKTFDGVFLAALLTVIGYSVNDSVVIFDRIRERMGLEPERPLPEIANEACLQTVPRTINTGLGAILILAALLVLGGDTLSDFALALLVGIVVGTYSSVFTATPVALALEKRFPRPEPEPETPAQRRARQQRERARARR